MEQIQQTIIDLVSHYPVIATILMVIGVARMIFKPFFSFMQAVVDATPSANDNEILAKVEASKVYKAIAYAFDWFGSIKLPK